MTNERTVKGVLGTKLGMTQLWDEHNRLVPVTVIQAGPCVVTQVRTPETDGYSAVQLGYGAVKAKNVTKPEAGHFEKAGVTPRRHRHQQGQGHRWRHEASRFRWFACYPRCAPQAPLARLHRRLLDARQGH